MKNSAFQFSFSFGMVLIACFFLTATLGAQEPKERTTLIGHKGNVWCVAFSHDGKTLASGGSDKRIRLWDLATEKNTLTLEGHTEKVWSLAFAPDDKTLISSSDDLTLRRWDLRAAKSIGTMGPYGRISTMAFRDNGKKLLFSTDGTLREWDFEKNERKTFFEPDGANGDVPFAFRRDGKLLAVATGIRKNTTLWNASDGTFVYLRYPASWGFGFSPDAKLVATGASEKEVHLWDSSDGKLISTFTRTGYCNHVAFSPDSKTIAIAYRAKDGSTKEGNVVLLETTTGKEIVTYQRHKGRFATITAIAFSPDGKTLASSSIDGTIKLYDVPTVAKAKQ